MNTLMLLIKPSLPNFNDDRGNISVFVDYYDRDDNSSEDPRWGNSDHIGQLAIFLMAYQLMEDA